MLKLLCAFFSKKESSPSGAIIPSTVVDDSTRLPREVLRALNGLKPTIFTLYRAIKSEPEAKMVLEDLNERSNSIKCWTSRNAAELLPEIEQTIKEWHSRDAAYASQFINFVGLFNQLRRGYGNICSAEETPTPQLATA